MWERSFADVAPHHHHTERDERRFTDVKKGTTKNDLHRVFVYGTLKRGFYNNKLLLERGAAYVGTARTCRPMRMVLGEYGIPYLLDVQQRGEKDEVVPGELWEVDDAGLDALDVLEGVDEGMYSRVTLDVEVRWKKKKMNETRTRTRTTKTGDEDDDDDYVRGERRDAAPEKEEQTVLSAFGYMTGPASLERGVGSSARCREIGDYSAEVHEAEYVPKHKRPAGSLGTRGAAPSEAKTN